MSGLFLLLGAVGMAIQGAFILVERKENFKLALVLKTTASIVFILAGLYAMQSCGDKTHARYIVAGLIMGGVGDVLLNLQFVVKKEMAQTFFIAGALAFLAGHALYAISLWPYVKNIVPVGLLITVIITVALMLWVYRYTEIILGLKIFGLVYIGAVVFITVLALGRYILQPVSFASLVLAVGGALFTASDVILIFNMFGKKQPWMRTANLSLYYAAQIIIASSLLFVM